MATETCIYVLYVLNTIVSRVFLAPRIQCCTQNMHIHLESPVPSASGSPEPRESTDQDPKSVTQESGCPKLRVCRSIMQEPMMGHLTLLGSPVPSASGSPERRGSTDPDPKSVIRESGCPKPRVCRSIMQELMMGHLTHEKPSGEES